MLVFLLFSSASCSRMEGMTAGNGGETGNNGQAGNGAESGNAGQAGNSGETGNTGIAGQTGDNGVSNGNGTDNGPAGDNKSRGVFLQLGSPSTMPSSGVYWAIYTVPAPPESLNLNQLGLVPPFSVNRLAVGELSTEELVAELTLPSGVNCATYTNPNDHAQYWAERIQTPEGQTTAIKLASTAANDFYLNLDLYNTEEIPSYSANCLKSDSGVHSPEGEIISDPYKDPELPIAGFKELVFRGARKRGIKIRDTLEEAGYRPSTGKYGNGEFTIDVLKELDSRALIEETILKPNHWKLVESESKGNLGVYKYSESFTGKIKFNWTYVEVPFTVTISDARLAISTEGEDVTTYTLSGTAEIDPKSFTLGGVVYELDDDKRKPFTSEDAFLLQKTPEPAVHWDYMESWQYVSAYGTPWMLGVDFITGRSAKDVAFLPVADLDNVDGTFIMDFMMPAYGGTATWDFEPEYIN